MFEQSDAVGLYVVGETGMNARILNKKLVLKCSLMFKESKLYCV